MPLYFTLPSCIKYSRAGGSGGTRLFTSHYPHVLNIAEQEDWGGGTRLFTLLHKQKRVRFMAVLA